MSSSGTIVATIPLLPCLPAILSPTETFLFCAIKTLASLTIPGCNSSPILSLKIFLSKLVSMRAHSSLKLLHIDTILFHTFLFSIHGISCANLSISKLFNLFRVNLVDFLIKVFPVERSRTPLEI